ncbi:MAG: O-antigen ligase family protein [Gaiellaceae bacterium]
MPTTESTFTKASLALPGALSLGAVALTAAANGGYFPQEWGWPALAFLLVAAFTVLVGDRIALGRLELAQLAAFVGFAVWTLLSIAWASSATEPVLSFERLLIYVAFVGAVFLVGSQRTVPVLLAGVLVAATGICAYALSTRVLPGRLESFPPPDGFQLSEPIGYWNGLGIVAALGALLALACATQAPVRAWRAAAAAVLPVLLTALYLTFSRGSSAAFVLGIAVLVAAGSTRLRLAGALAISLVLPAVAIFFAHRSPALSHDASLSAAASAGHRLALVVLACSVVAAALAWYGVPQSILRTLGVAVAALVLLAAVAGVVRAGGPVALVDRASDSFSAPLPATGGDLNRRLGSLSGNGRSDYWRVAWRETEAHPLLGGGAGSYERYWHQLRRTPYEARNAHSLYLETLAELGPVGLALLLAALAVPLAALARVRTPPAVAGAAAYTAFLAHAALDWDWQLPAVTLAGLACGAGVVLAARPPGEGRVPSPRLLAAALAVLLPLVAFAIAVEVGNSALAGSEAAANRDDTASAERLAWRAHRWAPWSAQPWQRLGEAQLGAGDAAGAARSLRHALRLDGTDWTIWADLAQAQGGAARSSAAAQAKRLNPFEG